MLGVAAVLQHLAAMLQDCATVQSCSLPWYLYSRFLSWQFLRCEAGRCRARFQVPDEKWALREAAEGSFRLRTPRLRVSEVFATSQATAAQSLEGAGAEDGGATSDRPSAYRRKMEVQSSVLLLYVEGKGYREREDVRPFIQQFRCYAERQKLALVLDEENYLRSSFKERLGEKEAFAALANNGSSSLLHQWVRRALGGDASVIPKLATSNSLLGITGVPLAAWAKPWSIERQLSTFGLVVFLDIDMTIRPDAYDVDIVSALRHFSLRRGQPRGHDVYVRDTSPYTAGDCLNSGFIAVRSTDVGRLLLRLWREKLHWAGVNLGDQGALAESLLELLALEQESYGSSYASECLPLLFPDASGYTQWPSYCECWQRVMLLLTGPYRRRRSRWVGFVDPERIDLNFRAHSSFPDHESTLAGMRLGDEVPGEPRSYAPFIVHWAGLGEGKLLFMEQYVRRFFNASPSPPSWEACPRSAPRELGAERLLGALGTPPIPDAPRRKLICQNSFLRQRESEAAGAADDPRRLSPWDYAAWWAGPYGCERLLPYGPRRFPGAPFQRGVAVRHQFGG